MITTNRIRKNKQICNSRDNKAIVLYVLVFCYFCYIHH